MPWSNSRTVRIFVFRVLYLPETSLLIDDTYLFISFTFFIFNRPLRLLGLRRFVFGFVNVRVSPFLWGKRTRTWLDTCS